MDKNRYLEKIADFVESRGVNGSYSRRPAAVVPPVPQQAGAGSYVRGARGNAGINSVQLGPVRAGDPNRAYPNMGPKAPEHRMMGPHASPENLARNIDRASANVGPQITEHQFGLNRGNANANMGPQINPAQMHANRRWMGPNAGPQATSAQIGFNRGNANANFGPQIGQGRLRMRQAGAMIGRAPGLARQILSTRMGRIGAGVAGGLAVGAVGRMLTRKRDPQNNVPPGM